MTDLLPDGNGTPPPDPKKTLDRLRFAITSRAYWVLASDNRAAAVALYDLAETLLRRGASASDVFHVHADHVVLPLARRTPLYFAVIAKSSLPAHALARLFRERGFGDVRAGLAGGRDMFPVSRDPTHLGAILDQVSRGRCFVLQPDLN